MNIHLPAILMFTSGTRFWHTAICIYIYIYIRTYIRIHYNNLSGLKSLESSPAATKKDSAGANTHGLTCFSVGKVTHHLKWNQEDNRLLQQAWPWCNECGRGPLCWVLQVPWVWIFFQLWKPWPVKVYYVFLYIYICTYIIIYIYIHIFDRPTIGSVCSLKKSLLLSHTVIVAPLFF